MKPEPRDYRLLPFDCSACGNLIFAPPTRAHLCGYCASKSNNALESSRRNRRNGRKAKAHGTFAPVRGNPKFKERRK